MEIQSPTNCWLSKENAQSRSCAGRCGHPTYRWHERGQLRCSPRAVAQSPQVHRPRSDARRTWHREFLVFSVRRVWDYHPTVNTRDIRGHMGLVLLLVADQCHCLGCSRLDRLLAAAFWSHGRKRRIRCRYTRLRKAGHPFPIPGSTAVQRMAIRMARSRSASTSHMVVGNLGRCERDVARPPVLGRHGYEGS